MILLINVCAERLHYYEFVKPIEDILIAKKIGYFVKDYKLITKKDLSEAEKIIICGTSLKDNEFLKNINKFQWIKTFEKPILGICAGMQVIGLTYGGKIKKKTEIGFYSEIFEKVTFRDKSFMQPAVEEFLGLSGKQEVWHLHNNFIDFKKLKDFEAICEGSGILQAVKHKNKEIYGVLFHPEVRQKDIIVNFLLK